MLTRLAKTFTALLAASVVLVPMGTARADVVSDGDRSETPLAVANPQISDELLQTLPESVLGNSEIWIDPEIPPGTPFLIAGPDGSLSVADGQTPVQRSLAQSALDAAEGSMAALASCSTGLVIPGYVTDLVRSSACAAIIGSSPSTRVAYTVTKHKDSKGTVSWVPWSFSKKWENVARPPLQPRYAWVYTGQWNSLGGANNMTVVVPWGAVAAIPKVKFTNGNFIGWMGSFTAVPA